ncbi:helix-turn-helix domain-containing protein, partial [Marivita sp.]|uniref:helix-turn-helix domain-containing protein n=1 Tax=Marivita sp. TaxID=2003365 RepID=UPI003F6C9B1D
QLQNPSLRQKQPRSITTSVPNAIPLLPYRQQDIADAMGLSLVHTNKTLAKLRERGIATWAQDTLTVHRPDELAKTAFASDEAPRVRPLI